MSYQNIKVSHPGQTIVSDAFLFNHRGTVSEAVAMSDQYENIVTMQRDYMEQRCGGLTARDKDWCYETVTAHTNNQILPGLKITYGEE